MGVIEPVSYPRVVQPVPNLQLLLQRLNLLTDRLERLGFLLTHLVGSDMRRVQRRQLRAPRGKQRDKSSLVVTFLPVLLNGLELSGRRSWCHQPTLEPCILNRDSKRLVEL